VMMETKFLVMDALHPVMWNQATFVKVWALNLIAL
jgi:hypothetical protein